MFKCHSARILLLGYVAITAFLSIADEPVNSVVSYRYSGPVEASELGPSALPASALTGSLRNGPNRSPMADGYVFALSLESGNLLGCCRLYSAGSDRPGRWQILGLPSSGQVLLVGFHQDYPFNAALQEVRLEGRFQDVGDIETRVARQGSVPEALSGSAAGGSILQLLALAGWVATEVSRREEAEYVYQLTESLLLRASECAEMGDVPGKTEYSGSRRLAPESLELPQLKSPLRGGMTWKEARACLPRPEEAEWWPGDGTEYSYSVPIGQQNRWGDIDGYELTLRFGAGCLVAVRLTAEKAGVVDRFGVAEEFREQAEAMQAAGLAEYSRKSEKGEDLRVTTETWKSPGAEWVIQNGCWEMDCAVYCSVDFTECSEGSGGAEKLGEAADIVYDLRNTWYDVDLGFGRGPHRFVDGQWFIDPESPSDGYAEVRAVFQTHITGRDREYCAIIFMGSGNSAGYVALLVDGSTRPPVTLAELYSSGEPGVSAKEIVTTESVYIKGDARCCPSQLNVSLWRWDGNQPTVDEQRTIRHP